MKKLSILLFAVMATCLITGCSDDDSSSASGGGGIGAVTPPDAPGTP